MSSFPSSTTPNTSASPPSRAWQQLIHVHDRIFSDANKLALKHLVIRVSIAGFTLHLFLIFLARSLAHPPAILAALGTNYLSAIATPFNFILFYEVLTLIAALPSSTTRSIANQFEIVSLIFIRDVFRDIASVGAFHGRHFTHETLPLYLDMGAGLAMFFLVALFQYIAHRGVIPIDTESRHRGVQRFIAEKKVVAIALAILLIGMAIYDLGIFSIHVWGLLATGQSSPIEHITTFYNDLFTVMIFTDVLVLILSLNVSGRYEMVFRNAAFIVSIILLRFSLTETAPYGAPLALLAMAFGVLTLLLFNFLMQIERDNPSN
jgi:hypothetical protein